MRPCNIQQNGGAAFEVASARVRPFAPSLDARLVKRTKDQPVAQGGTVNAVTTTAPTKSIHNDERDARPTVAAENLDVTMHVNTANLNMVRHW